MKLLKYLSLLIGSIVFFVFVAVITLPSSQIYGWPASISWHIFNDEIEFYDMRIKPPLRWRLEGKIDRGIILLMAPTAEVDVTKGLSINMNKKVTNARMVKLLESGLFPGGKMTIMECADYEIGGKKSTTIKYLPIKFNDQKYKSDNFYWETIVIESEKIYISIENIPIQYKPYFDELLKTITFI